MLMLLLSKGHTIAFVFQLQKARQCYNNNYIYFNYYGTTSIKIKKNTFKE